MDSQPQIPECRINLENFHPCAYILISSPMFDSLLASGDLSSAGNLCK